MKRHRRTVADWDHVPHELRHYDEPRWLAAVARDHRVVEPEVGAVLDRKIYAPAAYRAALAQAMGERAGDAYYYADDDPSGVRSASGGSGADTEGAHDGR